MLNTINHLCRPIHYTRIVRPNEGELSSYRLIWSFLSLLVLVVFVVGWLLVVVTAASSRRFLWQQAWQDRLQTFKSKYQLPWHGCNAAAPMQASYLYRQLSYEDIPTYAEALRSDAVPTAAAMHLQHLQAPMLVQSHTL